MPRLVFQLCFTALLLGGCAGPPSAGPAPFTPVREPAPYPAFTGNAATPAAAKPNIVFILADDLGYGDLGVYGQKAVATPNLDRLAAQGTRFTQFYAGATVCAPSRNTLMTGQHNGHTQIRGNAKVPLRADPEDFTLAALLRQNGYSTAMIGKWGLGYEGSVATPNKKGFDYFFGYYDQTHAHNYFPTFLMRNEERYPLRNVVPNEGPYGQGNATVRVDFSDDYFRAEALGVLDQFKQHQPFFLYLPFTLPHANNEGRPHGMEIPDTGGYAKEDWPDAEKGFAAMVTRLDTNVGLVLDKLKALGLDKNTLVIFASDNGPHEEGGHSAAFFHSGGPLRGAKRDLYEGGIRVPFIVRWPGHTPAGAGSDHVGYFGDFMATLAELIGAKTPDNLDSLSFLPTLEGKPANQKKHDYLYWEFYEGASASAVRFGDWKAIRSPMLTGEIQLYDLSTDLGEKSNVAAAHPDVVARAKTMLDESHVDNPLWRLPGQP